MSEGVHPPGNLFESIKSFIVYPIRVVPPCVSKIIWLFYIYFHILINDYLEEMAKTIYDYWFVQFEFPDENGNPYKTSGGKMKYSPTKHEYSYFLGNQHVKKSSYS